MARKRISQKPRRTILVVTATEAEALYFSQMRKDCRYANMTVVWEPDYKDLANLITLAGRMRTKEQYSSVWLVFGFADLDVSVQEVKELMPHAEKKKVNLAWNNPSLPLWYLLHLQTPKGFVKDPAMIESALAGQFPGFSSDAAYLLDEGLDLHLKLYSAKSKAAVNASSYNALTASQVGLAPTNMVALLNDITDICGLADLTHNQKRLGLNKNKG
ncbi:MAG: RloB domain-containing protein [Spirochaetaceae bacterium]|nr:RloB domain-containing protein [Spirochaetaceae bacterium]